ncbi:MAG TPA: ATP-dependent DNA helicase [Candidatus Paceibacterota bacterium]
MKTIFEERYAKLNPAQKEAVDTIEGPVMVIAGPGTGKTSILTLRIANILQTTDTPASGILAITYTDAGVKAMRGKLREIIGERAHEVRIHTFHGFAASIIHEFDDHFPHISRSKQMTDIEAETLVRNILKDPAFATLRPTGEPEFYIQKIVRTISDAKREAWTPATMRDFAAKEAKRIETDEDSLSTRGPTKGKLKAEALKRIEKCEKTMLFADVYAAYEEKKREAKKIDFDDLIIELIIALKNDELLLRLLQEKFLYLLVDEHQDTNDSQNLLIRMIADFFESPNLFIVGDEKQAIYRFQGASVENFLKFQTIWSTMKIISLKTNYRSHQSILDASYSLIENNYDEGQHENLRVKLFAGGKTAAKPIDVVMAGNVEAGERYLVGELAKIREREPGHTVALIARTNRDVERLIALLEKHSITAASERGADIFSHPLGILFFDLIRYLADPSEIESLARTIAHGLWNLSFTDQARLVRTVRSGNIEDIDRAIPALAILRREIIRAGALECIIHAADESGFTDIAARSPLSMEVWRAIVDLAADIAKRGSIESAPQLIAELLAYQASAENKSVKVSSGTPDAQIRITTAHGSKGLEYDYVFIPYAVEESWISRARSSYFVMPSERAEGDETRDARRLFYVALTRARLHVTLIAGLEEGLGKTLQSVRFIDELDPAHVSRKDIPAVSVANAHTADANSEAGKPAGDLQARRERELVDYAKSVLLERGLSVTALNHFCTCPSLFFYKSILKVPEPPAASAEKGNSMHEAIARVWALESKSEKAITDTLIETIREYFGSSLLPAFEKKTIVAELVENAPAVAKALAGHFAQEGTVATETWMEAAFQGAYGGETVALNLHGKLDAVLDQESLVFVFDYKTRGALSPAAIKGETKDSTGDYFRQLIFYKILIGANNKFKGKRVEPSLVFVKPDDKGRCPTVTVPVEAADVERVKGEVQSLIDSVWSGNMVRDTCTDPECTWCKLKKRGW